MVYGNDVDKDGYTNNNIVDDNNNSNDDYSI